MKTNLSLLSFMAAITASAFGTEAAAPLPVDMAVQPGRIIETEPARFPAEMLHRAVNQGVFDPSKSARWRSRALGIES